MKGKKNVSVWLKGVVAGLAFAAAGVPVVVAAEAQAGETVGTYEGVMPRAGIPALPPGFEGIGPVVSGSVDYSALPGKARKFLEKNCNGHAVTRCDKEFSSGNFLIGLGDGINMTFSPKGELVAIEAPANYSLSPTLLKAVVPGKLYKSLTENGFKSRVESVNHNSEGYELNVADAVFDHLNYSSKGVLTMTVNK